MVWLYILIDVILFVMLALLVGFVVWLWRKKRGVQIVSLSQFRNDDLYEQSQLEKERLAHIEDVIPEYDDGEIDTEMDEHDKDITINDIEFSSGYGREDLLDD